MVSTRLLIITQAIDQDDPILGFFHGWVAELAKRFEYITVICLFEGRHTLPNNVRVYSLGKEKGAKSSLTYAMRFYSYIWKLRGEYASVFVHMNQEYVLLGAPLWKALGKRIYLWRNHHAGSMFTTIAAALCKKIFCTSRYSYTARYTNTVRMPVGIDTSIFYPDTAVSVVERSILMLGRIAPSKRPDLLLRALSALQDASISYRADIVGNAQPKDEKYLALMQDKVQREHLKVSFLSGVPNTQTPELYRTHKVFVNCSRSGMYDKTIFEAAACGALVLASSLDWAEIAPEECVYPEKNAEAFAQKLKHLLTLNKKETVALSTRLQELTRSQHSLHMLCNRLVEEITL